MTFLLHLLTSLTPSSLKLKNSTCSKTCKSAVVGTETAEMEKVTLQNSQASSTAGATDLGLHIKCWEIMTLAKETWHGHIHNLRPLQQYYMIRLLTVKARQFHCSSIDSAGYIEHGSITNFHWQPDTSGS